MSIPDQITIVGSAYFQPIADLIEKLVSKPMQVAGPAGAGHDENGYSNSIAVLLVMVLESYASRVRFVRSGSVPSPGNKPIPDMLVGFFPDLPTYEDLQEVFMLRNLIVHNHVWHLDMAVDGEASTISTPQQLGFQTKQNYGILIDTASRKTRRLALPANPSSVDRKEVKKVFQVVWSTLDFMSKTDFQAVPLAGRSVRFKGKRQLLEELIPEL